MSLRVVALPWSPDLLVRVHIRSHSLITTLHPCCSCSWVTVISFGKSLASGTLIMDMPYGIQIQGGYTIPYKWATSASFEGATFTVCSMLYFREILHPQTLTMITVRCIPRNWNQRYHNISAGVQTTKTISARKMLPKRILDITSMPQGKLRFERRIPLLTYHFIRPDDDAQVTVSCPGRQGALLSLPFPAECEDTAAQGDFGKWLVKNIDCCMKVAEDLGLGVNRMEDIILVTGRHLARSWVNVVFSESRGGAQLSFVFRMSGNSGVHLEGRSATGGDLKLGPSGEVGFCAIFRLHPIMGIHGLDTRC